MGTESDHREKADHNQQFLETIDETKYPDWSVTVCFYKALHLVEMVFARSGNHSDNHRSQHDVLKRGYQDLWREYRPLYSLSRRARYKVRSMSPATVSYVRNRLSRLEALISGLAP